MLREVTRGRREGRRWEGEANRGEGRQERGRDTNKKEAGRGGNGERGGGEEAAQRETKGKENTTGEKQRACALAAPGIIWQPEAAVLEVPRPIAGTGNHELTEALERAREERGAPGGGG